MPILLATRSYSLRVKTEDCYDMLPSHFGLYDESRGCISANSAPPALETSTSSPGTDSGGVRMTATYTKNTESIHAASGELNLAYEKLLQPDIGALVLPATTSKKHLVFAAYSKEIADTLSSRGLPACLYDDGRERRDLIQKSADVILPVLAVVGAPALNITCGIIGAWIYDKFLRRATKEQSTIQVEIMSLNAVDGTVTKHRITGPAGDVRRLLEGGLTGDTPDSARAKHVANGGTANSNFTPSDPKARAVYESAKACQREGTLLLVEQDTRAAEQRFRNALEHLRSAYLLDGRPHQLSREMHVLGQRVQGWFSCPLDYENGEYRNACPVYLSHYVGGFSIGGTGRAICSICGQPMLDCEHVPGESYDRVIARRSSGGLCNICAEEACNHVGGTTYDGVRAFGIMTDIELDHIAYVSLPEDPLCTFCAVPLSKAQIKRQLSPDELAEFIYGKTRLYCTHCHQCEG